MRREISPAVAPRQPRLRSALVVLVVAAPPAAQVNLPRILSDLRRTVDDPASAITTLDSLAKLEPMFVQAPDSDVVHFRYLRGRALVNSGQDKAGCDELTSLEGKARGTRFEDALKPLLTACLAIQ